MKEYINSIQKFELIVPDYYELNLTEIEAVAEIIIINQNTNLINPLFISINNKFNFQSPNPNNILFIEPTKSLTIKGNSNELYLGKLSIYTNNSPFYVSGVEISKFTIITKRYL